MSTWEKMVKWTTAACAPNLEATRSSNSRKYRYIKLKKSEKVNKLLLFIACGSSRRMLADAKFGIASYTSMIRMRVAVEKRSSSTAPIRALARIKIPTSKEYLQDQRVNPHNEATSTLRDGSVTLGLVNLMVF